MVQTNRGNLRVRVALAPWNPKNRKNWKKIEKSDSSRSECWAEPRLALLPPTNTVTTELCHAATSAKFRVLGIDRQHFLTKAKKQWQKTAEICRYKTNWKEPKWWQAQCRSWSLNARVMWCLESSNGINRSSTKLLFFLFFSFFAKTISKLNKWNVSSNLNLSSNI